MPRIAQFQPFYLVILEEQQQLFKLLALIAVFENVVIGDAIFVLVSFVFLASSSFLFRYNALASLSFSSLLLLASGFRIFNFTRWFLLRRFSRFLTLSLFFSQYLFTLSAGVKGISKEIYKILTSTILVLSCSKINIEMKIELRNFDVNMKVSKMSVSQATDSSKAP